MSIQQLGTQSACDFQAQIEAEPQLRSYRQACQYLLQHNVLSPEFLNHALRLFQANSNEFVGNKYRVYVLLIPKTDMDCELTSTQIANGNYVQSVFAIDDVSFEDLVADYGSVLKSVPASMRHQCSFQADFTDSPLNAVHATNAFQEFCTNYTKVINNLRLFLGMEPITSP